MNLNAYVGQPYQDRGCWELVRLVYREQLGIGLPGYEDEYAQISDEDRAELGRLIHENRTDWYAIAPGDEQAGDVILFRVLGEPVHIGVIAEPGMFLHVYARHTACTESYRNPKWRPRVEGIYRYGRPAPDVAIA